MNIKNIVFVAAIAGFIISGTLISAPSQDELREMLKYHNIRSDITHELFLVENKIRDLRCNLSSAIQQKAKREEALTTCYSERNAVDKDLYCWERYTIDCSAQEKALKEKTELEKKRSDDLYNAEIANVKFMTALLVCDSLLKSDCFKDLAEETHEWNKNN